LLTGRQASCLPLIVGNAVFVFDNLCRAQVTKAFGKRFRDRGDAGPRWHNIVDLQVAIELFTPIYHLFLTDNDFWRADNLQQLDETIVIYTSRESSSSHTSSCC